MRKSQLYDGGYPPEYKQNWTNNNKEIYMSNVKSFKINDIDSSISAFGIVYDDSSTGFGVSDVQNAIISIDNKVDDYLEHLDAVDESSISVLSFVHKNTYIASDGTIVYNSSVTYSTTNYIPIDLFKCVILYMYMANSENARHYAIYDNDFNSLYVAPNGNSEYTVLNISSMTARYEGAKYIKICKSDEYTIEIKQLDPYTGNVLFINDVINGTNTSFNQQHNYFIMYSGVIGHASNNLYYMSKFIDIVCCEGVKWKTYNFTSSTARLYAIYDDDFNVLAIADNGDNTEVILDLDTIISAVDGAKYIIFTYNSIINTDNKFYISSTDNYFDSYSTYDNKLGFYRKAKCDFDYNIVLCYGQSLSCGYGALAEDVTIEDNCYMLGDYLSDSSASSFVKIGTIIADTDGEMYNRPPAIQVINDLHYHYKTKYGLDKNFIEISTGAGSQTAAQLMDPNRYKTATTAGINFSNISATRYDVTIECLNKCKTIADAEGKSIGVSAILFINGESDYGDNTGIADTSTSSCSCNGSAEDYIERVTLLRNDLCADILSIFEQEYEPSFLIANCSGMFIGSSFGINQAQIDIADNIDIFNTQPNYQCGNVMDGHLTSNGYMWFGELLAKDVIDIIDNNVMPGILRATKAVMVNSSLIRVFFDIPCPPLVFDTYTTQEMYNYGFAVTESDGTTSLTITSVTLYNTFVDIKTSETLDGTELVQYATSKSTCAMSGVKGEGNLRDSATYISYFKSQQDLPRTTSALEYQPKYKDGTDLTGHYYPMYNYCMAFRMSLT